MLKRVKGVQNCNNASFNDIFDKNGDKRYFKDLYRKNALFLYGTETKLTLVEQGSNDLD